MSKRINSPDTDADEKVRQILDDRLPGFTMVAGAGSGKTTSLVKALAHITATRGDELRASARKVACITYTEVAALEIEDELAKDPIVHVSTIHSFLWTVVKPFQPDIRRWVGAKAGARLLELMNEEADFSSRVQKKKRDDTADRIRRLKQQIPAIDKVDSFTYGNASDYGRGILGHEDITGMVPELILAKPLLAKIIARQYPVVFVDESQDTLPDVVACLKGVCRQSPNGFCLGFFGDPMQKIYVRGIGDIPLEEGWEKVEKPENFRSPQRVLDVINAIRKDADGLHQVSGLLKERQRPGEVTFFVLPADDTRSSTLRGAQEWLKKNSKIDAWAPRDGRDESKILVIAHRMAARRLSFEKLYETFHASHTFRDAFDEGRAWPIVPFVNTLIPLVEAATSDRSRLVPLLRNSSPLLRGQDLTPGNTRERLRALADAVEELATACQTGGSKSIEKALQIAQQGQLIELDRRLAALLNEGESTSAFEEVSSDAAATVQEFFKQDVHELQGYFRYIDRESPYSTHQGVKGAEYPYVLVVLDDEEGRHNQFSYDRLFEIKAPSSGEAQRREAGEETVVERTRRLLYVCASRATRALSIALYAKDVDVAVKALKSSGIPGTESPIMVEDL